MAMQKRNRQFIPCHQQGLTVLELMIVLAIISILASLGVPSFREANSRRSLVAAAEQIYSHIQLARLTAISTMTQVDFHVDTDSGSWQYGFGINDGINSCNAATTTLTDADACKILISDGDANLETVGDGAVDADDIVLKRFTSDDHDTVAITSSTLFSFDPVRGTLNSAGAVISLTSANGRALQVRVGLLGDAIICAPSGSLADYKEC